MALKTIVKPYPGMYGAHEYEKDNYNQTPAATIPYEGTKAKDVISSPGEKNSR